MRVSGAPLMCDAYDLSTMLHLNVGSDWLHPEQIHICVSNQDHGVEVYQGPKDDQAGAEYEKWADFVNSTNSQIGRIVQARNLTAAVNKGENVVPVRDTRLTDEENDLLQQGKQAEAAESYYTRSNAPRSEQ